MFKTVGGYKSNPGSRYDDFNLLYCDYFRLLLFLLDGDNFEFDIKRNGLKGKIKLEYRGFVLYTQPRAGVWDYNSLKCQRLVSADFVLFLFTSDQITNSLNNYKNDNNTDILKIMDDIKKDYFFASLSSVNSIESGRMNALYSLLAKFTLYSKPFYEHYLKSKRSKELLEMKIDWEEYDKLSSTDKELLDNWGDYTGEYYSNEIFYMSLGCFSHFIRANALYNIYSAGKKNTPNNITDDEKILLGLNDPIKIEECFFDIEYLDSFGAFVMPLIYEEDDFWNYDFSKSDIEFLGDKITDVTIELGDDYPFGTRRGH